MTVKLEKLINLKNSGNLKKFAIENSYSLTAMYNCIKGKRDYTPRGSRKEKRLYPIWEKIEADYIYNRIDTIVKRTSFEFNYGINQAENLRDFLLDFTFSLNVMNKDNPTAYLNAALKRKVNDFRKRYDNIVYSYYDTDITLKTGRPLTEFIE